MARWTRSPPWGRRWWLIMFLMYVDESGDCGLQNSPTDFFILSGLVVHELRWQKYLDRFIAFRRRMREKFGLPVGQEIHASALISRPGKLVLIKRHDRLAILRAFADELSNMPELNAINVCVKKRNKDPGYDVFTAAWQALIQRFENTMSARNFSGPANPDDRGMIFPDRTDDKKLTQLLRQLRRYNPIPNQPRFGPGSRNMPIGNVIGDPSFRDSHESYYVQAADVIAYLLHQQERPNSYMRRKGGRNYFTRLEPILCKVASSQDPQGVVRL